VKRKDRQRARREHEQLERDSLIHQTIESFERDDRLGAKLVMADGTTLMERVDFVGRSSSPLSRVVGPDPSSFVVNPSGGPSQLSDSGGVVVRPRLLR
jgi:hypothetical protein